MEMLTEPSCFGLLFGVGVVEDAHLLDVLLPRPEARELLRDGLMVTARADHYGRACGREVEAASSELTGDDQAQLVGRVCLSERTRKTLDLASAHASVRLNRLKTDALQPL